jgi:TRIAD3 protein (E3 ubiquitin-protein ligase RNF216)
VPVLPAQPSESPEHHAIFSVCEENAKKFIGGSMAPPEFRASREIIVLSDSETEDEGLARRELEDLDAPSVAGRVQNNPHIDENIEKSHAKLPVNDHEAIDLTAIPDVDIPPSSPVELEDNVLRPDGQAHSQNTQVRMVAETACLQMILSVLPDISVEYVLKLIQEKTTDATRTVARCEHLLTEVLEGEPYPKEAKEKKRKREDEAEHELSAYEKGERGPEIHRYDRDA